MPNDPRIKKVSAYPIAAALVTKMGPATAQIYKLTQVGMMCSLATPFLQPGEKLEISFELPVTHRQIKEQCVVIKLYNHWTPGDDGSPGSGAPAEGDGANTSAPITPVTGHQPGVIQHIAEIHFKPLTRPGLLAITEFLKRLGLAK